MKPAFKYTGDLGLTQYQASKDEAILAGQIFSKPTVSISISNIRQYDRPESLSQLPSYG